MQYKDTGHLSSFGSLMASVETSKILAREMNIPLDEGRLLYYQSYFFKDYQFAREDDMLTITLIPEDAERSKDLVYKWEITENNHVLYSEDYRSGNSFSFSIPEQQKSQGYKIHVWIRNPEGDFVLEGIFTYLME